MKAVKTLETDKDVETIPEGNAVIERVPLFERAF